MKRRNRAALLAAGLMFAGALVMPRTGASYQVPIDEPMQKGDPDQPVGRSISIGPRDPSSSTSTSYVFRLQIAPGVFVYLRFRFPELRRETIERTPR